MNADNTPLPKCIFHKILVIRWSLAWAAWVFELIIQLCSLYKAQSQGQCLFTLYNPRILHELPCKKPDNGGMADSTHGELLAVQAHGPKFRSLAPSYKMGMDD